MVQLISFGQLSIFLLLPIILLVVLFLQDYIPLKLMEYYPLIDNHIFIEAIAIYLSKMIGGILELISRYLQQRQRKKRMTQEQQAKQILLNPHLSNENNKKEKTETPTNKGEEEEEEEEEGEDFMNLPKTHTIKWKVILCIFLITFCDYGYYFLVRLFHLSALVDTNIEMLNIFLIVGLSKWILKYRIYKQSILSAIFLFIGYCLYTQGDIFSTFTLPQIYVVIGVIGYAFQIVLEKYIMVNKLFSPYELLFYEGIIGLVLNLIIFSFMCIRLENGIISFTAFENVYIVESLENIKEVGSSSFVYYLIIMIISFIVEATSIITNFYLNPSYVFIGHSLSMNFLWIYIMITFSEGLDFPLSAWLGLVGIIIFILGLLIDNEIIIIHVFGFDKNTRNAIILRAMKEEEDSHIEGLEDVGHISMIDKRASMETPKKSIE